MFDTFDIIELHAKLMENRDSNNNDPSKVKARIAAAAAIEK